MSLSVNNTNISSVFIAPSEVVEVTLPGDTEDLDQSLFHLHRKIESQYQGLPWPAKIQKVVVMTEVVGGRGDIAAAAKAIAIMQQVCPELVFDWVLSGGAKYDPATFLRCNDSSKITIRDWQSMPIKNEQADFMLTGPVKFSYGAKYVQARINREIVGPTFGFTENAEDLYSFSSFIPQAIVKKESDTHPNETYRKLHTYIFPGKSGPSSGLVPMGIQPGTGLFLDQSRIDAPLSRGYCCPSYLLQIQNVTLRQDILEAMNCGDDKSVPDYDKYSFNSGYAHHPVTWAKFIDCVAIHEHTKHVVIVLNSHGEFKKLSTQDYSNQIFTPERLSYLKQKGYGRVVLKGEESKQFDLQKSDEIQETRDLTVIIRPSFLPSDMKQMQLASERLLATGDNSALEAWCARCKLYLYEDVANMGCKWRFLQQQVDLANTISPALSKLLALFGGDKRLPDNSLNKPLNTQQMSELEDLLNDPKLSEATIEFCHHITENYSFQDVLIGAIKRTVWHHYIPELAQLEAEVIDDEFKLGLVSYLKNEGATDRTLTVRALPELGKRVQECVAKYHQV